MWKVLFALFVVSALTAAGTEKRTILAVFAHPDDETTVSPLLAKYAAEGHDVYLVTVTSGQMGISNTDIPAGPQLGAVREKELRCAAARLGIHQPFLLQFEDGNVARSEALASIVKRLREIVNKVKPDVIITFGPEGVSGHPDHRIVGAAASEVFQWREKLDRAPRKLYYVVLPASLMPANPREVGLAPQSAAVSDEFVTTVIDGSDYMDQTFQAMQCHVTQWAPVERMKRMFEARKNAIGGKVFLRQALPAPGARAEKETDILAGLE